jgi:molybdopterin-guanine dinucleotide biosynthesis protein A
MDGYDGVVLAGGQGRRMGIEAKSLLTVGGRPMIAASLAALAGAERTVVVGPGGQVIESPPGGGPVAALAAGLTRVTAPVVVVLAADLPFVTSVTVELLVARVPAVAVDTAGRPQFLLAAYRTTALQRALPDQPDGVAMRAVVARLQPQPRLVPITADGEPPEWWDCDTPTQLQQARRWSTSHSRSG